MQLVPKLVSVLTVAAATLASAAGLAYAVTPSLAPSVSAANPAWGTYQTVAPVRVLDTRNAIGAPKAPLGQGGVISLSMLGSAGVPATGVSAVVLNLTVTAATKPSYLTVWPAGTTRPTASSINFVAGINRANLVTVPLGAVGSAAGKVSIFNNLGSVQVIADVMGYYVAEGAATAAGLYQNVPAERLLDSRDTAFGGPFASHEAVSVPVDYNDPAAGFDANSHIRALAVNITAVRPTMAGFLTAWDGVGVVPTTSTLNFAPGTITPNMAIVPVAPCMSCGTATGLPSITVVNGSLGTVHVLVDIVGFYDDGNLGDGMRFRPLTPTRIVDTRTGLGTTTFTAKATKHVTAPVSVAGDATLALVTNTTAVRPTLPTFLTLWDGTDPKPTVSNLNAVKDQIVANATITDLALGNVFSIYNDQGVTNVVVDVTGTMEFISNTAPAGPAARSAAVAPRTWTSSSAPKLVR